MPLIDFKNINLKDIDLKDRKTQVTILMALIALIAATLYFYFIFFPQVVRVVSLVGKTVKIKSEIVSSKSIIAKTEGFKKHLADYNQKVEVYENKLPAEQEIPNLLEGLSTMAKNSKIKIVSIVPVPANVKDQKSVKNQIYQEIPILITAKSGYHELGHFLSDLENADRFMKVIDIDIKANKTTPNMHDVELMVCTYVLLPEK